MIITIINCKDKLLKLGLDIDAVGGWDNLRNLITTKLPNISCSYDCVDNVLSIEVDDNIILPDMSSFGEVQPNGIT